MSGALDTVFQVIAEMAVNRAKSLALELAQKKLRSACEPLKSHLPNLCARIGSDPLLELLRNRNPLVEALEEDIVIFMIKKAGLPKDWKPVARELGLILRSSVKTGKLPTEEVVIPLIESRLEDLVTKVKPTHADELRVIRVLLREYREAGYDLDVLNWPVLRQFRLPSLGESRYVSEFSSAWQWASGVIDERWPSKCLPNTDCKAERVAQLAALRVSPVSFIVTDPVFFRQLKLFIELAESLERLREGSLQSSWMPRIRALLQDKDPKAQARQMIHVVYDFMKENLEEKQAPLLETLRRLSMAVLDRQPGEMLRIFIDFLKAWDPCGEKTLAKEADACRKHMVGLQKALKKSLATIQLVVGLLEEGPKDEKPDEAKKRRIQLLEEFTKTMSSRQDRAGEWILSLGVSAVMGLSYGCQYTGQGLAGDLENAHWNPPALSLPLGISVEHFHGNWGFHGMVYPFDLGQYVRTSQDEGEVVVPEPTYTNAFTFGLQLAVAYLFHDIPLTFGLDVRYIPVLEYAEKDELPDGTIQTVSPATRHVQVMLFVGFHFPLLDFN
ncbi:MAG: hypothetical protein CVU65_17280 [Deltaproteobacteria bacterium HGW-Deltaproteobacteria-22]|nr:MAG: hypothetical protein CVU65_17280 [Deltaproteobacteria bacterium HGW-Deltaproteobacteria-22]